MPTNEQSAIATVKEAFDEGFMRGRMSKFTKDTAWSQSLSKRKSDHFNAVEKKDRAKT